MREYSKARRANETIEQKKKRQEKDLERKKEVKQMETSEKRLERQKKNLECKRNTLMNETQEKRKKRQQKDLGSKKEALMRETQEKRKNRQQKNLECKKEALMRETQEKRKNRQQNNLECKKEALMKETKEKRKKRQQKDLGSKKEALMRETQEERKKRQQKDLEYKHKGTKLTRLSRFRERTRWGPCFPCISCHQILFKNQVFVYEHSIKQSLKKEFQEALSTRNNSFLVTIEQDEGNEKILKTGGTNYFLCNACYHYLKQEKYPPKIASNCLEAVSVPNHVQLSSYLEEALIARVLLFMKIFSLRSSLMPAIKDKCIVIPLDKNDVINNVESLPRLPSETGIIDIQWKRRLRQKNYHLQAKVDPQKLFDAIQFLKHCNNKHYINTQSREEYEARCKAQDPDGYQLIFGEDSEINSILK